MSALVKITLIAICVMGVASGLAMPSKDDEESLKPLRRQKRVLGATTVAMISAGIGAGASLASTGLSGLMGTGYTVELGLEIENYSKYALGNPQSYNYIGYIKTPPRITLPAQREAVVVHKSSTGNTGAYGVLNWKIGDTGWSLQVMYAMPYSFDWYTNYFAIGFLESQYKVDHNAWSVMYYYDRDWFVRGQYYYSSNTIKICNNKIRMCAEGLIGTSHIAKGHVYLIPMDEHNLAPKLRECLTAGSCEPNKK